MKWLVLGVWCGLWVGIVGAGEPSPRTPPTRAELDRQLAELGQQQVSISFAVRDQAQKNENLWLDPQYTSPEIENLRKRLEGLQQELLQVQLALRTRVAELPAAKAEIAKLEQGKAAYQAVARQVEEIKNRRTQLP